MLSLDYDYEACIRNSEKVAWKIDEVMPASTRLDFARPFLPAALSGRDRLGFLSEEEAQKLNQISGNAYLNLFAFVEETILPSTLASMRSSWTSCSTGPRPRRSTLPSTSTSNCSTQWMGFCGPRPRWTSVPSRGRSEGTSPPGSGMT